MIKNYINNILNSIEDYKREIRDLSELNENGKYIIPICVDFDGTCVINNYAFIGKDNKYCVEVLQKWVNNYNVGIVLDTMRDGKLLYDAVNWFKERNIPLYGINSHPNQHLWKDTSNKSYGIFSVDDRNLFQPLIFDKESNRARVDWKLTDEIMTPILEKLNE